MKPNVDPEACATPYKRSSTIFDECITYNAKDERTDESMHQTVVTHTERQLSSDHRGRRQEADAIEK